MTISVDCPIRIETNDGHQFDLLEFSAADSTEESVIVFLPAMGVSASFYVTLAEAFQQQGHHFFLAEMRGIGSSNQRASRSQNFGYAELLQQDIPAILADVKQRCPNRKIWLMGHSLGGQLHAQFAALNPDEVEGLLLVASCSTWFRGWKFPVSVMLLLLCTFYMSVAKVLGYFPGQRLGFGGLEAKGVMRDWWRTIVTGRYKPAGISQNVEQQFREMELSVLAISIQGDNFAPRQAVQNLVSKFHKANVTHEHFTGDQLPKSGLDHFRWAKTPQAIVSRVGEYLSAQK